MIKRIVSIVVLAGVVLYACTLAWPTQTEKIAIQIIKGVRTIHSAKLPLPGYKIPALKVVDPEAISSVLHEDVPLLASIFSRREKAGAELVADDIIDATNKRRIEAGLPPLRANALLTATAVIKTEDMINLEYFEHASPSGVTVSDLGKKVGYDYLIMGENLALGNFENADDLLDAWMNSEGHRANIMSNLYQEIGVYAAKGTFEGREVWFAVQHFGTGRESCPTISRSLKKEIDGISAILNRKQDEINTLQKEIEAMQSSDPGYKEKVDRFNILVGEYNIALDASKGKISQYNIQVAQFNGCLGKFQKPH